MSERPNLRQLAARMGFERRVPAPGGDREQAVDDTTLATLLAARGFVAEREEQAGAGLVRLQDEARRAVLEPVAVMPCSAIGDAYLAARLDAGAAVDVRWTLELQEESGQRASKFGAAHLDGDGRLALPYPWRPPAGYHQLTLTVETGNRSWSGEQRWIVVPDACPGVAETLGRDRATGVCVNLYTLRSDRNWGIGDFTDLIEVIERASAHGADFVALSPLHALRNRWPEISPYSPLSRLFRNPLYLDVEAVPELASCADTRAWLAQPARHARRAALRAAAQLDYDAVAAFKMQALRRLHTRFAAEHRGRDTARGRAYAAFRHRQGELLDRFAVFQALDALLHEAEGCADWHTWPQGYRRLDDHRLNAFVRDHAELVDFHRYLQFETDRQLATAADAARAAGMRIGLVQDLALGAAAGGFDPWAFPELFVSGVDLGCPPDPFNAAGQNWALPPIDPRALAADGYRLFTLLVRHTLRHGGGLRIDHVLGLVRQLWIPAGEPATAGAYLHQAADHLFGILALESTRAGALVVGEDLGTVPAGMDRLMARWNVLSTRVLYFARDDRGEFLAAGAQPARALALVTTHDLPTFAAWWSGHDLALDRDHGTLADDRALEAARAVRDGERQALLRRLRQEDLLPAAAETPPYAQVARAVHTFLARSPAALVGVWLEDLAAETAPVNLPGLGPGRFRAWSRRLDRSVDALFADPEAQALLAAARRR